MNREAKLEEMCELAGYIVDAAKSAVYIPMCYVRQYNQIVKDIFGGEDPEILEGKDGIRQQQGT